MKQVSQTPNAPRRNLRIDSNRVSTRLIRPALHGKASDAHQSRRARRADAPVVAPPSLDAADPDAPSWKQMFDEFLSNRALQYGEDQRPFEIADDYQTHFADNDFYAGVKSFLDSRGIRLAYGDPSDSNQADTICGLANRLRSITLLRIEPERAQGIRPDL